MSLSNEKVLIRKETLFKIFEEGIKETSTDIKGIFGGEEAISKDFIESISFKIDEIHKRILEEAEEYKKIEPTILEGFFD